jgi:large subunit ribosomal protein L28
MSRRCKITGKGSQNGHKVSHANNKSNKITYPNLQYRRLFDSESGKWVKVRLSTRVLRTVDKKGLSATLRDLGKTIADLA